MNLFCNFPLPFDYSCDFPIRQAQHEVKPSNWIPVWERGEFITAPWWNWFWKQLYMTTYRRRYYRLPTEFREGNVFSCVCLSFCLSTMGPCVTITYDTLYLTVHPHPISDLGPHLVLSPCYWHLVANTVDLFKLVDLRIPPPPSNICWWPLKHVRFASKRNTSYWNAFLFLVCFSNSTNTLIQHWQRMEYLKRTKRLFLKSLYLHLPLRIPCSMSSNEKTCPPMLYDVTFQNIWTLRTDSGSVSHSAKPWIVNAL